MKRFFSYLMVMATLVLGGGKMKAVSQTLSYGQFTNQPWEAKYFKAQKGENITPGNDWYTADFDDSSWKTIYGPISNWVGHHYFASEWGANDYTYWVRRHFTLASIDNVVTFTLSTIHDDECTIYLNGNLLYSDGGVVNGTKTVTLSTEQISYLREGDNIIAAVVSNSGGAEAYMDFGLDILIEDNGILYSGLCAYEVVDKTLTEYTIKEGTTSLAAGLFSNCTNMTSVTIPSSVVSIGENAFSGCSSLPVEDGIRYADCYAVEVVDKSLTEYSLKSNLRFIGNALFENCTSLTSVDIPSGVIEIGANAFKNCTSLASVSLPSGVTSIGVNGFYACQSLSLVTLSEGLESIGNSSFAYCTALSSITIPSSVKLIASSAFYGCQLLSSVTLQEGLVYIGESAFYNCSGLTAISIPLGVENISSNSFYGCSSLKSVSLPDKLTQISDFAFAYCSSLSTINIPNTVRYLPNSAFLGCNSLPIETGIRYVDTHLYEVVDRTLSEYVIKDGVTLIPANFFSGCSNMTNVTIPSTVESIGDNAFYGCTSLPIENGIRYADCYAIEVTNKTITQYVLKDNVRFLGNELFKDCSMMTSVNIPSGVTAIGNNTFSGCSSLTSLVLPESVTSIGAYAFHDCSSLTSVNIPSKVSIIGEYTFYNCSSLTSLELPDDLTSIGSRAFYKCSSLSELHIPKMVTQIGSQALVGLKSLVELELKFDYLSTDKMHLGLSDIDNRSVNIICHSKVVPSFEYIYNYSEIGWSSGGIPTNIIFYVPRGYYDTYKSRYYSNKVIDNVDGDNFELNLFTEGGISYANSYALEVIDKTLTEYTLKDGTYTLGNDFFRDCSWATTINIPSGVTKISDNAFYGCSSLTTLTLPETVTSIGRSAFYGCSALTSINIPSGVTVIGDNTFYGCSSLTSLTLPETVASIRESAFHGCSSMKSINIPLGLTNIENDTFSGCSSLTSLTLPDGLLSIGESAFSNCSALVSLTLPENLTSIANRAFYYCSSLSSIDIPSNVTAIDDYAFYGCSSLSSVNFPENLISIGREAFRGCALTSLKFPKGLTSIGEYAFSYCPSLDSVTIPEGFTSLSNYVFYECSAMRTFEWPSTLQEVGYSNINGRVEIESHATTPPVVRSWPSCVVMYVPEAYGAVYKEQYPDWIIIEGTGCSVAVDITTQGTLGEEILKQVNYLNEVNHLTISGVINDTDINTIRNSMPNLISVDLSEVNMENVPANFLYEKRALSRVVLPNNAKVIGSEAFRYCSRLRDIVLPSSLERIDYAAFFESGIEAIDIPAGVTVIGHSAFDDCYYLKTVNIPIGIKRLEERVFSSCKSLNTITLPDSITYIGSYAFDECSSLTSIELPKELVQIDREAFARCTKLDTIYFPEKLTTIGYCAFYECTSLKHLTIPSSVSTLDDGAFHSCRGLLDAFILDGVTYIGHHAFNGCYNLSEVTLPSTLRECSYEIFIGCSKLSKVTCNAFFPPIVGEIVPNNTCTLYVPELTLNRYKLANNWSLFSKIEPISGIYPANISVYKEESLTIPDTGLPQDYKPNMTMETLYTNSWTYNAGKLTVIGNNPLPLSAFEMQQRRDAGVMSSLVNHGTITADNVVTDLTISIGTWHFLSFPYDVKISDIVTVNDWVISRYDGEARANEDFGNTWKTLPYDSILHAGEGYIWHSQGGNFTVPAIDNENKNLIFANDTRYIQLKENPAATEANYGWNLIGNPYPCYYDTRYMQFSSPITVRSGESYAAYSPVDDSYILSPLEAFFVQCSAENNIVSFDTEGRQTDNSVRTLSYAPARTRAIENARSVLNLYLESNDYADHTRLVVNEGASLAYEIACDAAKFMSDDAAVQQLFTIEGGERMAINERPLANGKAALGVYIGKAGSYTLSLDTKAMDTEVFLVDKLQGTEADLTNGSYAFTAEAGTFTDRFEIHMKRTGVVDGIDAVATELKVEATADGISVSNATTPIYIYSATGALVDTKVGSAVTFDVPQGVYVVKVGDNVHKVVVK